MNALSLLPKTETGYNIKLNKGLRFLFIGPSGSGKSNAAVSFPKPMWVFDIDHRINGIISALKWLGEEEFSKIDYKQYTPTDGFEAIDKKCSEILEDLTNKRPTFATVQFSSLGPLLFNFILDSQNLRLSDKPKSGKRRGKVNFPVPDDYNYNSIAMRILMYEWVFKVNELGVNVIFDAWPVDKWGRKADAGEYDPPVVIGQKILGPGNAVEEALGYFDEVYVFRADHNEFSGKSNYYVRFKGGLAKTSLNLPGTEVEITETSFYDVWAKLVQDNNRMEIKKNEEKKETTA